MISPLLANIYLHYSLDLWAVRWRRREATGDMIIVRYADDFIIGVEHESDARRFLDEMRERLGKFALSLHPEKTRLIEFGRFAALMNNFHGIDSLDLGLVRFLLVILMIVKSAATWTTRFRFNADTTQT